MDSKQSGQSRIFSGWRTFSPSTLLRVSPQAGLLLVNIVLWVIFGLVAGGFLSGFNLFTLGRDIALFTAIGLAQMIAISMGEMNLSVGAIVGVAAIFAGWLIQVLGDPIPPPAILPALLLAGIPCLNAFLLVH